MSYSLSFVGYNQRRKLTRSVIQWFIQQRSLGRFKFFLDINDRRCRSVDGNSGTCSTLDSISNPRMFEIEIDNTQDEKEYVSTLFHELIHVEQRLRGYHQHRYSWTDYCKWKGEVVTDDVPYKDQPWEKEARKWEKRLTRMYFSAMINP